MQQKTVDLQRVVDRLTAAIGRQALQIAQLETYIEELEANKE